MRTHGLAAAADVPGGKIPQRLQVELSLLGRADECLPLGAVELQDWSAAVLFGVAHPDSAASVGDLDAVGAAVAIAGLAPADERDLDAVACSTAVAGLAPVTERDFDAVARSVAVAGLAPARVPAVIHDGCPSVPSAGWRRTG